jgi:hypothetical protein
MSYELCLPLREFFGDRTFSCLNNRRRNFSNLAYHIFLLSNKDRLHSIHSQSQLTKAQDTTGTFARTAKRFNILNWWCSGQGGKWARVDMLPELLAGN